MAKNKESEWMVGSSEKIWLYFFISLFFSIGMCIQLVVTWNNKTDKVTVFVNFLVALGFFLLVIFQYRAKWIYGLIIIGVSNIFSLLTLYRSIVNLQH